MAYLPLLTALLLQPGLSGPGLAVTAESFHKPRLTEVKVSFKWLKGAPIEKLRLKRLEVLGAKVKFPDNITFTILDKQSSATITGTAPRATGLSEDTQVFVQGSYEQAGKKTSFTFRVPLANFQK